jgi:2-aminobenzoate-CoA ligase
MRIVQFGAGVTGDLADLAAKKSTDFENIRTASDDVCMLAFTSGTTGQPKATMHFHRDVLAIVDTYARHVLKPSPGDLFAGSPPLAFTFGLGGLVVFPLAAGAATLLLDRASPQQLLEAVGHHGVTTLFTAPTAYRAMLPHLKEVDIGTLHTCVSAGESLPAATWQAFRDGSGIEIMDGIGSTEMLHIFISAGGNKIRPGATGQVVPGYVAEVQDASGNPVADGEFGRLAVKGPTGCRYLGGDRQNAYVQAGWNLTGDTFVRDADGYFWFQARADDMIISSGYNIAGPEVENALLQHPDVAEVVVVGFPDPARGTIVKAFVVPKPGVARTDQTIKTLQDFVKAQIAPYKYPRAITFVDSLPRTSTGKVQRFQLRRGGP